MESNCQSSKNKQSIKRGLVGVFLSALRRMRHPVSAKDLSETSSRDMLTNIHSRGLLAEGKPLRLHLGCGEVHIDGYINIDYPPTEHTVQRTTGADIFADITVVQFPGEIVDEVRLYHVFEHFNRAKALALCIKWQEWLKIGGILHIETPDLIGSARQLSSDLPYKTKQAVVRHLFGSHEANWAYHYDGWYDEKFRHVLSRLGFSVQCRSWQWEREPYLANVEAIATKTTHLSRRQLLGVADSILLDSTVADAPTERRMHKVWCREIRQFLDRAS